MENKNPMLYTYCIPIDDGAAPNPYWGICTLAICKPVIRRTAMIGDWVVGAGSTKYEMQNKVVYAMKVTQKLTLAEYDKFCKAHCPNKIPDTESIDIPMRAGDCVYYQGDDKLLKRPGIHNERNYPVDTGGLNVLLSDNFYYFGKSARIVAGAFTRK